MNSSEVDRQSVQNSVELHEIHFNDSLYLTSDKIRFAFYRLKITCKVLESRFFFEHKL